MDGLSPFGVQGRAVEWVAADVKNGRFLFSRLRRAEKPMFTGVRAGSIHLRFFGIRGRVRA
jgi:hypothetical protein